VPVVPAWTIDDNVLFISSHVALLREMLDTKDGVMRGVEAKGSYRELLPLLDQPSNAITYQDVEAETKANREALNRVTSMSMFAEQFNDDMAMIPAMAMDRVAYLLELTQVYKASGKRTVMGPEGITSVKHHIKEDLSAVPNANKMLQYNISAGAKPVIEGIANDMLEQGNLFWASVLFETLAEHYPQEGRYLSGLAQLYIKQGKTEQANEALTKAIEANPDTKMVILREKMLESNDASAIIERVQSAESIAEDQVSAEKALFGTALHKLQQGQPETAQTLFDHIVEKYPFSPLTPAAQTEVDLMRDQESESVIAVTTIRNVPVIDGKATDPAWQGVPSFPLFVSANEAEQANAFEAKAKLIRGLSAVYVLIEGSDSDGWSSEEENFVLSLGPSRDYTHIREFITQLTFGENAEVNQIQKNRIFDDYGLVEDAEQEQVITDTNWEFKRVATEEGWTVEFAVPLQAITSDVDNLQTTWLLNIVRVVTSGDSFVQQSANGQSDTETPSFYLFADLK